MSLVTAVQAKGEKAAILVMDDGSRVWTPEKVKADELIGKPIPSDWTRKDGEYGPQAFPPRAKSGGGGQSAWRNTKEGAWFEAVARAVNTAVMQSSTVEEAETWLSWSLQRLDMIVNLNSRPAGLSPASGPPSEEAGQSGSMGKAAATAPSSSLTHDPCGGTWKPAPERAGWLTCDKCSAWRKDHSKDAA